MKSITGKVVSIKMAKTVVVERELFKKHPLYKKTMKRNRRVKAHTDMELNVGDTVKLVGVKPISKEKHYKVAERYSEKREASSVQKEETK